MTSVVGLIDLAADHVLTVVWLKGALFVGSVLLLRLGLRRASASARSMMWTVSVAALIALTALHYLTPQAGPVLVDFPTFLFRQSLGDVVGLVTARALPWPASLGWAAEIPVARWLGIIWLTGAAVLLGRLTYQVHALRRTARAAESWRAVSSADISVGLTSRVETPLTFGWRRPQILLPSDARAWSTETLSAVLAHETAHVRRHDFATLVLTEIVKALYWVNPLAWKLASTVRAELECACDDAVLRSGLPPVDYVRHLLSVAARINQLPQTPVLHMAGRSLFRTRVSAILDAGAERSLPSLRGIITAAVFSFVLAYGLAGSSLWACGETTASASITASTQPR